MSQCTRTRGLVLWLTLLLALALPLASSAAEDEETAAEEQTEEAKPAAEEPEDEAETADSEAEDEGAEGEEIDWEVTHSGLYIIASGSYAFLTNNNELEKKSENASNITGSSNSNTDDSWGYGGRVGWRVFDRLAVEGQFQMLNSIVVKSHQESNGNNRRSKATFMTAMANAKGYLLTERIQPYGMVGVGYGYGELRPSGNNRDQRDDGFAAQFGIGTDFYATEHLGLMTELAYTLPTGDIEGYDNIAILFGLMLHFGGH